MILSSMSVMFMHILQDMSVGVGVAYDDVVFEVVAHDTAEDVKSQVRSSKINRFAASRLPRMSQVRLIINCWTADVPSNKPPFSGDELNLRYEGKQDG